MRSSVSRRPSQKRFVPTRKILCQQHLNDTSSQSSCQQLRILIRPNRSNHSTIPNSASLYQHICSFFSRPGNCQEKGGHTVASPPLVIDRYGLLPGRAVNRSSSYISPEPSLCTTVYTVFSNHTSVCVVISCVINKIPLETELSPSNKTPRRE